MARVLGAVRLSRLTDESTSPERQREQIETWARLHGHTVAHITTDTDVSGAISPFKRPDLGPWLSDTDKLPQWDILVTAKLDRASRSIIDLLSLVQHLDANGKGYASVAESAIDTTSAHGRMLLQLLAVFAEFERARMAERRREAAVKLKADGKWIGGQVPYGMTVVEGKLTVDTSAVGIITLHDIADRLIRGETLSSVLRWLDDSSVPAPKAADRKHRNARWHITTIKIVVRAARQVLGATKYKQVLNAPRGASQGLDAS